MKDIFLKAAKDNDIKGIRILLDENNTLLEETDEKGCSALYLAAKHGSYDVAEYLLNEKKANPNHMTINGWSPLHVACVGFHLKLVELLLSNYDTYIDWNQNANQYTPLHLVVSVIKPGITEENKNAGLTIVDLLLEDGANIELQDCNDRTAVEIAKVNKSHGLIKKLDTEAKHREEGYDIEDYLEPTSSELDAKHLQKILQKEKATFKRVYGYAPPPTFNGFAFKYPCHKTTPKPIPTFKPERSKKKNKI